MEGFIVSAAVLGAALGSACGGPLSDRLGRKPALKLADIFFAVGALVMAAAPDAAVLILGDPSAVSLTPLLSILHPIFMPNKPYDIALALFAASFAVAHIYGMWSCNSESLALCLPFILQWLN